MRKSFAAVGAATCLVAVLVASAHFLLESDTGDRPSRLARAQAELLAARIDVFQLDNGRVPGSLEELLQAELNPDHRGPYANERDILDPWRVPFYYRAGPAEGTFIVFTLGSDGRIGGAGNAQDIQVERP